VGAGDRGLPGRAGNAVTASTRSVVVEKLNAGSTIYERARRHLPANLKKGGSPSGDLKGGRSCRDHLPVLPPRRGGRRLRGPEVHPAGGNDLGKIFANRPDAVQGGGRQVHRPGGDERKVRAAIRATPGLPSNSTSVSNPISCARGSRSRISAAGALCVGRRRAGDRGVEDLYEPFLPSGSTVIVMDERAPRGPSTRRTPSSR